MMFYTEMTDEELDEIIYCATLEKTNRINERKAKCMKEIQQAVAKFNENFGTLYICDFDGEKCLFNPDSFTFDSTTSSIYPVENY